MLQKEVYYILDRVYEDTLKIDNDFSRKLPGDIKDHELQPRDLVYWNRHQIKDCLQSEWEEP